MITVLLAEEYLSTWNSGARMEYQVHILLLAQQTWYNASYGPPYKGTAQPQNSIVPRLRKLVLWFAEYFPLASCPVPLRRKSRKTTTQKTFTSGLSLVSWMDRSWGFRICGQYFWCPRLAPQPSDYSRTLFPWPKHPPPPALSSKGRFLTNT